jgi:hypothetical protein
VWGCCHYDDNNNNDNTAGDQTVDAWGNVIDQSGNVIVPVSPEVEPFYETPAFPIEVTVVGIVKCTLL